MGLAGLYETRASSRQNTFSVPKQRTSRNNFWTWVLMSCSPLRKEEEIRKAVHPSQREIFSYVREKNLFSSVGDMEKAASFSKAKRPPQSRQKEKQEMKHCIHPTPDLLNFKGLTVFVRYSRNSLNRIDYLLLQYLVGLVLSIH